MTLETETASTFVENVVGNFDRAANEALREGVKAAQTGDRSRARAALLRASELDPSSESAWLWLASISEYPEELIVFLNNVLDINPHNARANEWMSATKSLLAKTFVQRGMDAANGGQADFAVQCFHQALENDQSNSAAWHWLANLADSSEGKLSYLEKVIELDPDNQDAQDEFRAAKDSINQSLLSEARAAAVAGRKGDANDLLDAFIAENPNSVDGWILRSHLADAFGEKIAAFERVLEIDPSNLTAMSGVESLKAIMATVSPATDTPPTLVPEKMENTAFVIDAERRNDEDEVHPKSPTQELVFPAEAADLHERMTGEATEEFKTEELSQLDTTPETTSSANDWAMNTVAFSFSFPGGEMSPESDVAATEVAEPQDDELYETSSYAPVPSPAEFEEDLRPISVPFDELPTASAPESLNDVDPGPSFVPQFEETAYTNGHASEPETVFSNDHVQIVDHSYEDSVTESSIPMPIDFSVPTALAQTGFETTIVRSEPVASVSATAECPFCSGSNPAQAFTCGQCLATLTLSDLEMALSNSHADKAVIREAVKELETIRESAPLSEKDLTNLGIAYLNLRDFQRGYDHLVEASQLNPNNVVLSGQVNSLLIRLDEIKRQEEALDAMPKEKKILVVDDSATVRKLIAGKLEKCGHEVYCAADGVEAIEQLDTVIPDLILLDITMPRMDGYQVCKVIRSKETTKDIPVVMISGKDGFFDKVRGRMAGTTGYITKPFGPETLMKAVETYLKGEELQ